MATSKTSRRGNASVNKNDELVREFAVNRSLYAEFTDSMAALLSRLCHASNVSVEVSSRVKEPDSFKLKLERKTYAHLSEVPDLAGVRLIVQYPSDIQKMADIISQEFAVIEDVDHASPQPDSFGYASRHLIVRLGKSRASLIEWKNFSELACEVQVRTILQHAWASISHSLDYKTQEAAPEEVRHKLFQVAALIEVGDSIFEAFHKELSALQKTYEASTSRGHWRELPINVETLTLSWDEWKPERLIEQGDQRGIIVDYKGFDEEIPSYFSQIASLCSAMRIATLGELHDFYEDEATVNLFDNDFKSLGRTTRHFFTLVLLYFVAKMRETDIPSSIDSKRLNRSIHK